MMNRQYELVVPKGTRFCFDRETEDSVDLAQLADGDMESAAKVWWKVLNACAGADDYLVRGFDSQEEMKTARSALLRIFDTLVNSCGGEFVDISMGVNQLGWVMRARAEDQASSQT